MTEQQVRAETMQALADYNAGVPDAYQRFQYWSDELARKLPAVGENVDRKS